MVKISRLNIVTRVDLTTHPQVNHRMILCQSEAPVFSLKGCLLAEVSKQYFYKHTYLVKDVMRRVLSILKGKWQDLIISQIFPLHFNFFSRSYIRISAQRIGHTMLTLIDDNTFRTLA